MQFFRVFSGMCVRSVDSAAVGNGGLAVELAASTTADSGIP
jgi:hypothetical protein